MKKILIWLMIFTISVSLVFVGIGCKTTTAEETTAEETTVIDVPAKKVGIIIWGVEDTLSAAVKRNLDAAAEVLNVELVYATGDFDSESQLIAAENLIAAEVDAIMLSPMDDSVVPRIAEKCADANVALILFFRDINDPAIAAETEKIPNYLGYTLESEVKAGKDMIATFSKNGAKNVGLITMAPGFTVTDKRKIGFEEGIKEYGLNQLAEVVVAMADATSGLGAKDGIENFIATFGDEMDCIAMAFGEASAVSARAVIENSGKVGQIQVGTLDSFEGMATAFQKGIFTFMGSGTYTDPLFSFIVLFNYLHGTPLTDGKVELTQNYIYAKSYEEVLDFIKYIDNKDIIIYSPDEIKQMAKLYNPDFTLEDLKKIMADYSIEDVKSRLQ